MAQRRMFSLEVVDTDKFLDMPASTQNLYFHLGMRADDDGFVSSPKKITTLVNCSGDDLKLLITKGLIIPFPSGVCVVKDWKTNNCIQKDRYHETKYLEEKSRLQTTRNGTYVMVDTPWIQDGYKLDTQVRLGRDRLLPPIVPHGDDTDQPEEKPTESESLTVSKKARGSGSPPVDHSTTSLRFERFWAAYPKKAAKKAAEKAFHKLNPDETLFANILAAVDNQKDWDQWNRDGGKYIPNPATWLNQSRWEDEQFSQERPRLDLREFAN